MKKTTLTLCLMLALSLTACKKQEGTAAPAAPAVEQTAPAAPAVEHAAPATEQAAPAAPATEQAAPATPAEHK